MICYAFFPYSRHVNAVEGHKYKGDLSLCFSVFPNLMVKSLALFLSVWNSVYLLSTDISTWYIFGPPKTWGKCTYFKNETLQVYSHNLTNSKSLSVQKWNQNWILASLFQIVPF